MFHINCPGFVGDDVGLFKGITSDIFPKTKKPEITRKILQEELEKTCRKNKWQPTPWLINKALEFYEMLQVQHGIMIIGRPLTCKSVLWVILSESLSKLCEENRFDQNTTYYKTVPKVINPKSLTIHQLYGLFDPKTHEWTDGVLGSTFRYYVLLFKHYHNFKVYFNF